MTSYESQVPSAKWQVESGAVMIRETLSEQVTTAFALDDPTFLRRTWWGS